ncbi:MAG TPA: hypothetical protein PKD90_04135 [Phnomibacter sp.]|nr:hypothetical protein [Phnomibacter sp.]
MWGGVPGKGFTAAQLSAWNSDLVPATFLRGSNNKPPTQLPKACINYMFLDEQFTFVSGYCSRVGTAGAVKSHWNTDAQMQCAA